MNLDKIIHPLVHVPNTDDTKYDEHGRVSEVYKNGLWNLKVHKDLKNFTPQLSPDDGLPLFSRGDLVKAKCTSLYGYVLDCVLYFDCYDKWDNTCFVSHDPKGRICYNVKLTDVILDTRKENIK
jgi:hypothetical protein